MNKQLSDEQKMNRSILKKTIISFSWFFIFAIIGYFLLSTIMNAPKINEIATPFRAVLDLNAKLFARNYVGTPLSKEFPKSVAARKVRVNGMVGLRDKLDTANYVLRVIRYSENSPEPSDTLLITLADLRKLPKTEVIFNFKCIEGWSQISWWGGVRFSDFAKAYHLGTKNNQVPDPINHADEILNYAGLKTIDSQYYVGIDMPSMMHPQTILCYEMNGQPLKMEQGSPLRLIIPVKYGIKHLKKIGTLFFSQEPPPDYWGDRGYDYFSGL